MHIIHANRLLFKIHSRPHLPYDTILSRRETLYNFTVLHNLSIVTRLCKTLIRMLSDVFAANLAYYYSQNPRHTTLGLRPQNEIRDHGELRQICHEGRKWIAKSGNICHLNIIRFTINYKIIHLMPKKKIYNIHMVLFRNK